MKRKTRDDHLHLPAREAYFSQIPAKPEPLYTPKAHALLADAFDEIDARWDSVENSLDQVLDVDTADLETLRASYLE